MLEDKKYIYLFEEGSLGLKKLLGGKGASLAQMTKLKLPVPSGMTITTEVCSIYNSKGELPNFIKVRLKSYLKKIEEKMGKKFGDNKDPLLLSVRSGAVVSMPGMMDTILNLGLNDQSVKGLAQITNDNRFAYDCYRRFIAMFGEVVLKINASEFSKVLVRLKKERDIESDLDLNAKDLQVLINKYKEIIKKESGNGFPQDPMEQLIVAIEAVFSSWNNERAVVYRDAHNIDHKLGTAVNIQAMVFGNKGEDCGTGVVFTRDPSTGEDRLYGEYLLNAQGEDVVAGIRTPLSIKSLQNELPEVFEQLVEVTEILEDYYQDMQDIEFTIEEGRLYLLQTRTAKRTAQAAIKIAVDMVKEGLIDKKEALLRVKPGNIERILHQQIDPEIESEVFTKGLPASPGAAYGEVVFSADEAERLAQEGKKVILVSLDTTPEDIHGVIAAEGVLTSRGGMTSHAAVVARGMGKPCVCGSEEIKINSSEGYFVVDEIRVSKGELITISGATGEVMLGKVKMIEAQLNKEAQKLLDWADEYRDLNIRTNADNPEDAKRAVEFGVEGIGLCRTEHMFMTSDRVPLVQKLILSQNDIKRKEALNELEEMQCKDFIEIFKILTPRPVTVRLLDPPLHEFLPDMENLIREVAVLQKEEELSIKKDLLNRVRELSEVNPMLGFRGCRLGIIISDIYKMQIRAIFKAVMKLHRNGTEINPEIMIPLISHVNEFKLLKGLVKEEVDNLLREEDLDLDYKVGTMMELPRACLTADEIAQEADFFSFGSNDLTQTTYGFSRDDAESKFLQYYLQNGIMATNPFISLDENGVGRLIKEAVGLGRGVKKDLKIGICGEHGGEADSIALCHSYGLDYVSCSPYRVPVARLAAAQAKLKSS